MSKYTTQLRFICEELAGLTESSDDYNTVINTARPLIFNFTYPFFTDAPEVIQQHPELEGYKQCLETKILKHYYMREIGFETYGLFKLALDSKLNEIMPYYNKLYLSELLSYDPLTNVDGYETNNRSKSGENENTSSGTSESHTTGSTHDEGTTDKTTNTSTTESGETHTTDKIHDTPQNNVGGTADNYLSQVNKSDTEASSTTASETTEHGTSESDGTSQSDTTGETTGNSNGNFSETEDATRHIYGKHPGTDYADLVTKYRDTFLNIDMQIIDSLGDLFFYLW